MSSAWLIGVTAGAAAVAWLLRCYHLRVIGPEREAAVSARVRRDSDLIAEAAEARRRQLEARAEGLPESERPGPAALRALTRRLARPGDGKGDTA